MKRIISYLVLFSYMMIILKPVLPLATDAVAHVFWKLEHISTVHRHGGDNHVHQEIMEAEKKDQSDKSSSSSRYEVSVNPHLVAKFSYDFSFITEILIHNISSIKYPPETSPDVDDPPPKVLIHISFVL